MNVRHWVLILGDQLNLDSSALDGFDPAQDRIVMIEAPSEATAVWSHKARITLFLSAMRHFCNEIHRLRWPYTYVQLDEPAFDSLSFVERLKAVVAGPDAQTPIQIIVAEPGEWRMQEQLQALCADIGAQLDLRTDRHFMCTRTEFARWAAGKKELRMEFFYREMRSRHHVLMQGEPAHTLPKGAPKPKPLGDQWNFDADNRAAYPKTGPGVVAPPARFEPDATTQAVIALVEQQFPGHPGELANFAWPVTREQALTALKTFVDTRLVQFGAFQDAMWTDAPWGWHALISTSLNLHLLDPREVIAAAVAAFEANNLELASVEGFVRQVLGWREFVRGVYWHDMPQMRVANHYQHQRALPAWYWSGKTRMACMQQCIGQTLQHGYAHHIQRLMVTGQFALLAQVKPQAVCDWYLAVYVDAVEWVELPNTAGMALFAHGPRMTSKPYIASGAYIDRQSNYCKGCAYEPGTRHGPKACPVTTLYWHFLENHQEALAKNPRTALMAKNLLRLSPSERAAIGQHAAVLLADLDAL